MGRGGGSSGRSAGRTGARPAGGGAADYESLEIADDVDTDAIAANARAALAAIDAADAGVKFTEAMVDAAVQYTEGYTAAMNALLRGNFDAKLAEGASRMDVVKSVADLRAAMRRSPGLDRDRVLFRGLTLTPQQFAAMRQGGRITDPGFQSTSLRNAVSSGFIADNTSAARPINVMLRIRAKKGTKGVYANHVSRGNVFKEEAEFIMAPGTSMRVRGVSGVRRAPGLGRDTWYTVVDVEVD